MKLQWEDINFLEFDMSKSNRALDPEARFFCVKDDHIVTVLPTFRYLEKFTEFRGYCFEESSSISVIQNFENRKFHKLYISLFNTGRQPFSLQMKSVSRNFIRKINEISLLYHSGRDITAKINSIVFDWQLEYPIFMKTELTSGKNDNRRLRINNNFELLHRMCSVRSWSLEYEDFLSSTATSFPFYVTSWRDITEEYRFFVYRRKIVSVCPQVYYNRAPWANISTEDLDWISSTFIQDYAHDNYSIDAFRNNQGVLEIIETNEWYNSGPGLFRYAELMSLDAPKYRRLL
jgi:hypothetical protein